MKKILFLLMFVLATASSIAQEKYPYYCTISGTRNLANKIRLDLEWGEQKQLVALRDENGKKIEFNITSPTFLTTCQQEDGSSSPN